MSRLFDPRWPSQTLVSAYTIPGIGDPIVLHDGPMAFDFIDNRPTPGHGTITLQWFPTPYIRFDYSEEGSSNAIGYAGGHLTLPGFSNTLPTWFYQARSAGHGEPMVFHGRITEAVVSHDPKPVSHVLFHIANLLDLRHCVRHPYSYQPTVPAGRVLLINDDWQVVLDPAQTGGSLYQDLYESGSFTITHVGRVERCDGREFTFADYDYVARLLRLFLSFVHGYWVVPMLPVGFDGAGEAWRYWEAPRTREWHRSPHCFPEWSAWTLLQTFPRFSELVRHNGVWSGPLQHAIQWYLAANDTRTMLESRVVLSQVALELLARVAIVEDLKRYPRKKFDALKAADQLRSLLGECGIDSGVPSELVELETLAKKIGASDGPEVVTMVRNALVHSGTTTTKQAIRAAPGEAFKQAWQLGMWYLDLVLLRLLGHTSHYANRLAEGRPMLLPWGAEPPASEYDVRVPEDGTRPV